jgi:sugar phosphate isomerase/epimerase
MIYPAINMEFIRCEDKSFADGVKRARAIGYDWIEPMVHNGRELLSEAGYFHSVSMDEDPLFIKDILDANNVKASGLSAHTPLMRPEIAVPYLEKAIRFAKMMGTNVVNTDEGIRPAWLDDTEIWYVMGYTLKKVLPIAEKHGVFIGIEPHQSISKTTEGLLRIANLVDSPMLRINYDTGNAFLGGADPYDGLRASLSKLIHVHAKDISIQHAEAEKGKVTGTPVGCACGDGVIDWAKVVAILNEAKWSGALSVECGTPLQAERSLSHLNEVLAKTKETAGARS